MMEISFEAWLAHAFDHPYEPEVEDKWYFSSDDDIDWWDAFGYPAETVAYLTRLFSDPVPPLEPFTDDQIGQGLHYLASNACSDTMFALFGYQSDLAEISSLPPPTWEKQEACLRSMVTLFEQIMAPRCGTRLGHKEPPGTHPPELNTVCYMWWDTMPVQVRSDNPERFHDLLVSVMAGMLAIDSIPCQESALHGLGHWHMYAPRQVEAAIDRFETDHTALREYASRAREGRVL
ncbi:MAG: hypothetical protein P8Z40_06135 [Chloroflexota bacterium]